MSTWLSFGQWWKGSGERGSSARWARSVGDIIGLYVVHSDVCRHVLRGASDNGRGLQVGRRSIHALGFGHGLLCGLAGSARAP